MTKEFVVLMLSSLNVEKSMVSVERLREYTQLPHEAPSKLPNDDTRIEWPDKGEIIFENYSLRYREDFDFALRDISIEIKRGEKVILIFLQRKKIEKKIVVLIMYWSDRYCGKNWRWKDVTDLRSISFNRSS